MWGTQEIPEGPLQASETHPSTPQSHEPANQGEFQITAPLGDAVAHNAEAAVQEGTPPQRVALLIDDTGSHRYVAASLMKRLGFEVEHAENGLQGL